MSDAPFRRLLTRVVNAGEGEGAGAGAGAGEEAEILDAIFREMLFFKHPVEFWSELGERGGCLFVRRVLEEQPTPAPTSTNAYAPTRRQSAMMVRTLQALFALVVRSDANKRFFAKESCAAIVRAARHHHKNPDVVVFALLIVPELCRGCPWAEANVAAFSTAGLAEVLLYALHHYARDPNVVVNALLAMTVQNDACWAAHYIPQMKLALGMCELMKWHPTDRELHLAACQVLGRLLAHQLDLGRDERRSVVRTLTALRQTYAQDAEVLDRLGAVLRHARAKPKPTAM